ncbi:hypothetical protein EYF80_044399 [Liparis tanakae]|uniref:Uncharacterized protein n=1 Tax=Liparis tanakae TaxID=230148 RepID=A0A4Z2FYI9_9TELE|nr:hypothetical protein EYF80_044399 [Liparis tanakae]
MEMPGMPGPVYLALQVTTVHGGGRGGRVFACHSSLALRCVFARPRGAVERAGSEAAAAKRTARRGGLGKIGFAAVYGGTTPHGHIRVGSLRTAIHPSTRSNGVKRGRLGRTPWEDVEESRRGGKRGNTWSGPEQRQETETESVKGMR